MKEMVKRTLWSNPALLLITYVRRVVKLLWAASSKQKNIVVICKYLSQ